MELIDFVIGLMSGILSGSIAGYFIEHYRLKNSLMVERIKRLTPQIEIPHPIVEELCDDVAYFRKANMRGSSIDQEKYSSKKIMNGF